MLPEPLTAGQRAALCDALVPFATAIERVDVYGSRARGDHRPGSDVDLVLIGPIDQATPLRIAAAIEASDLSIHADVMRADDLSGDLAVIVANEGRMLLTRADLTGDASRDTAGLRARGDLG